MISGIAVSLVWKLGFQLSDAVYEVFPGMAAGFVVYLILTMFNQQKKV